MGEVIGFDRQRFSAVFPSEFRHVEEYCWNLFNDLKRANVRAAYYYSEYDHEACDTYLCLEILPKHHTQMTVASLTAFSYQQQLRKYNVDLILVTNGVYRDR
jgi:hypothetical protein